MIELVRNFGIMIHILICCHTINIVILIVFYYFFEQYNPQMHLKKPNIAVECFLTWKHKTLWDKCNFGFAMALL